MLVLVSTRKKRSFICKRKLIKGTKYHWKKSLNLFLRKWRWVGTRDNIILKIIKNCYYQKKCENQLQAWKPIQKSKIFTNILFPNLDAILYVLSFQKYKKYWFKTWFSQLLNETSLILGFSMHLDHIVSVTILGCY